MRVELLEERLEQRVLGGKGGRWDVKLAASSIEGQIFGSAKTFGELQLIPQTNYTTTYHLTLDTSQLRRYPCCINFILIQPLMIIVYTKTTSLPLIHGQLQ